MKPYRLSFCQGTNRWPYVVWKFCCLWSSDARFNRYAVPGFRAATDSACIQEGEGTKARWSSSQHVAKIPVIRFVFVPYSRDKTKTAFAFFPDVLSGASCLTSHLLFCHGQSKVAVGSQHDDMQLSRVQKSIEVWDARDNDEVIERGWV